MARVAAPHAALLAAAAATRAAFAGAPPTTALAAAAAAVGISTPRRGLVADRLPSHWQPCAHDVSTSQPPLWHRHGQQLVPQRGFFAAASAAASAESCSTSGAGAGGGGGGGGGGGASAAAPAGASELHVVVEPLADALEGVSVVTLARAGARNAIGRQLLRELREAVDLLRQERTTRCVVLRSSVAGAFCSGADLKERAKMTQAETLEFVSLLRRTMSEVQALPMPTIAAIDGFALGGGAELALAADIRVAGAGATFAFPEAQLGIIPGAGGTQRLPRLVGASRAKELIFTGRRVKAEEAAAMGLVDHLVQEDGAHVKALEIAALIAKSAPLSLRMAKAAVNHGLEVDLSTGLHMEEAYYAQLVPTKDRQEGLKAFAEKRSPVFKGE